MNFLEIITNNTELNCAIQEAAKNGHVEIVESLLQDSRVNPSVSYNRPINLAVAYGHTEVVRILLQDKRVDPSDWGNEAIILADRFNHSEIIKLLLNDPRVDWRIIQDNDIVKDLLNKWREDVQKQYITSYLCIKQYTTKPLDLGKTDKGYQTLTTTLLPKTLINRILYRGIYEGLCSDIPFDIHVPPMKLIALTNALGIEYDIKNINCSELINKVKEKLFNK